jgi:hypothetical protein
MIKLRHLAYRAITVSGQSFQTVLLAQQFLTLYRLVVAPVSNTQTCKQIYVLVIYGSQPLLDIHLPIYPPELTDGNLKGLGCTGFARHYFRHRCLLSLPQGTKMFQFPCLPLSILCVQIEVNRHDSARVSPFGYLRFKAC